MNVAEELTNSIHLQDVMDYFVTLLCVFVICRRDTLVSVYPVVCSAIMQVWNPLGSERLISFEKNRQFLSCQKD